MVVPNIKSKSVGIDILTSSNPDVLDYCPIQRPAHVLPFRHLPGWRRLPLDKKIPAKSDPLNPVVYTRPKLGKSLHYTFEKKDFDTRYVRDLPLDYNPLHDPHLQAHFKTNMRNYFNLIKKGWALPYNNQVVCNQKLFNQYREYSRNMMVKQEMIRRKEDGAETKQRIEKKLLAQVEALKTENKAWKWLMSKMRQDESEEEEGMPHERSSLMGDELRKDFLLTGKTEREKRRIVSVEVKKLMDYERKINKKSAAWNRMATEETKRFAKVDEAKREYQEQYKKRAKQRQTQNKKLQSSTETKLEKEIDAACKEIDSETTDRESGNFGFQVDSHYKDSEETANISETDDTSIENET